MAVRDPVEVYGHWVDRPPDEREWQNGSGYPLAARLVLTAAHVVCPAGSPLADVRVRATTGELRVARVAWHDSDVDVALVEITDPTWVERTWPQPVRWGRLVTHRGVGDCVAAGFPAVVATPEMRDRLDARGSINPGSRSKSGMLAMDVTNPPAPPHEGSRWAGMSGAAVVMDGLIIGVAVQDPKGFDSRQLVALPVTRVLPDSRFRAVVREHCGHSPVAEPVELEGLAEQVRPPRSPAGLLRADVAETPFRRRPEFDLLVGWCRDGAGSSIRLVHGPGGQGKTRLARHLVREMAADGWASLMLGEHATRDQAAVLADVRQPTLVVVDYAEGRADQLEAVIDALGRSDTTNRLLLLARTAGAWRTDRVGPSPLLEDLADDRIVQALHPLETTVNGRAEAWAEALHAFSHGLARLADGDWAGFAEQLAVPPLDGDRYRTILAVQMDALSRLLGAAEPLTASAPTPEHALAAHERRYWERLAARYRITLDPTRLEALVTTATLWGAPTQDDADRLMSAVVPDTDLDQRVRIDAWLHGLYGDGERHWAGLQPDRLAEHLVGTVLRAPSQRRDLVTATVAIVSAEQREAGLTVLGRATGRHPELTAAIVETIRAGGSDAAVAALALATRSEQPQPMLDAVGHVLVDADLDTLKALNAALPRFSLLLAPISARIGEAIADQYRTRAAIDRSALPDLAWALTGLGPRLGEAGRRAEGLAAAQEAADLRRELATLNRDAYLPDLAASVNNLAVYLAEAGRRTEGLAAAQEAADLCRELATLNRDAYLPDLAASVNNLAIRLAEAGRRTEGLAAAQEAADLYRELAASTATPTCPTSPRRSTTSPSTWPRPDAVPRGWPPPRKPPTSAGSWPRSTATPTCPTSPCRSTTSPSDSPRPDAVPTGWPPPRKPPTSTGSWPHSTATPTCPTSPCRSTTSPSTWPRPDAVPTGWPPPKKPPTSTGSWPHSTATPTCPTSRCRSTTSPSDSPRPGAVPTGWPPPKKPPTSTGSWPHSTATPTCPTSRCRSTTSPSTWPRPDAVPTGWPPPKKPPTSTGSWPHSTATPTCPTSRCRSTTSPSYLAEAGRRTDGLAAAQEAADLRRELATLNRDAYLPDLAMSVNNLAVYLAEAGRRTEGLAAAQEAADLDRELATLNRDAYLPDLATSVNNLAVYLAEAGRRTEGLAAAQEAADLRRELATLNRDAYLPDLATSVNNLAVYLAEAGRRTDGLAAAQEAADLRRELATLNRDAYLPDLAMSVNNLAVYLAEAGRRTEGLAAAQEAVDLYRELAVSEPDLFGDRAGRAEELLDSLTMRDEAVIEDTGTGHSD